ncbi:hypothetical protein F4813DRAFT_172578 [Daldinia decipiens]|uniref:uncharacterized protein n=1 Tax=Daldinia decipiens TaxID=326647 RepID=UPI0020C4C220|nr:uncharacterized protein F4813DRAFT_172578 [Daldinia decipiens]KAI1661768.1 hypothetical protein F4813DRAFT_172578 [Daldinia decipiens]
MWLCVRWKIGIYMVVVTEYLYWGIVEYGVGCFAACLPTLQFLFRHLSRAPIMKSATRVFSLRGSRSEGTVNNYPSDRALELDIALINSHIVKPKTSATSLSVKANGPNSLENVRIHDIV